MTTISVSRARATLTELIARVTAGEEVTLTRHGTAVAVLVRPDALRPRRAEALLADAGRVGDLLATARETELGEPMLSEQRAHELVDALRADRARR